MDWVASSPGTRTASQIPAHAGWGSKTDEEVAPFQQGFLGNTLAPQLLGLRGSGVDGRAGCYNVAELSVVGQEAGGGDGGRVLLSIKVPRPHQQRPGLPTGLGPSSPPGSSLCPRLSPRMARLPGFCSDLTLTGGNQELVKRTNPAADFLVTWGTYPPFSELPAKRVRPRQSGW